MCILISICTCLWTNATNNCGRLPAAVGRSRPPLEIGHSSMVEKALKFAGRIGLQVTALSFCQGKPTLRDLLNFRIVKWVKITR